MNYIETTNGRLLKRCTRWLKIRTDYNVTSRHQCYYYAEDIGNGENCVDYFMLYGHKIALNRFYRFGTMFTPQPPEMWYENDVLHHISGYDSENYFDPMLIELDPLGEYVRVYREVTV